MQRSLLTPMRTCAKWIRTGDNCSANLFGGATDGRMVGQSSIMMSIHRFEILKTWRFEKSTESGGIRTGECI